MAADERPPPQEVGAAQVALDAAAAALDKAARRRLPNRDLVDARRRLREAETSLEAARRAVATKARGAGLRPG